MLLACEGRPYLGVRSILGDRRIGDSGLPAPRPKGLECMNAEALPSAIYCAAFTILTPGMIPVANRARASAGGMATVITCLFR
jgi:hypothetical protein